MQAAIDEFNVGLQRWTAAGAFDGDVALVPSCIAYFVIGIALGYAFFSRRVDERQPTIAATATPEPGRRNLTRSSKRRQALASGRRRRSCPDDLELKMVLVVRKDAKLKADEVAMSCSQAAIDAVALASKTLEEELPMPKLKDLTEARGRCMWWQWLEWWNEEGVAKVVVKAENQDALDTVQNACTAAGLPFAVVSGAVVAVGPAPIEAIDEICGDFKLY
jgi:peptidyl-tRNA hydrolase